MDEKGQGNNGAGHEDQAHQANAVRRRTNRQAVVGEQAGDNTYMECRRNVSLSAGRYTVDGCSEFLKATAAGENPMLCVACGCHRSFHRKVVPTHYRDSANYLLFNGIPLLLRPVPQPLQPPQSVIPQPEMPHVADQSGSEEEIKSGTDEQSEDRSELDTESEDEEVEMIDEEEEDGKED